MDVARKYNERKRRERVKKGVEKGIWQIKSHGVHPRLQSEEDVTGMEE